MGRISAIWKRQICTIKIEYLVYDKQKNAQMFSKSEEIEAGMQWELTFF